jgi:hypothetical protein
VTGMSEKIVVGPGDDLAQTGHTSERVVHDASCPVLVVPAAHARTAHDDRSVTAAKRPR